VDGGGTFLVVEVGLIFLVRDGLSTELVPTGDLEVLGGLGMLDEALVVLAQVPLESDSSFSINFEFLASVSLMDMALGVWGLAREVLWGDLDVDSRVLPGFKVVEKDPDGVLTGEAERSLLRRFDPGLSLVRTEAVVTKDLTDLLLVLKLPIVVGEADCMYQSH